MEYQRRFGVEIEFKGNRAEVANKINMLGMAFIPQVTCVEEGYNHHTRSHWKIVTDASLGYDNAGEVVSPILQGSQGIRELELVCQALELAGATVDRQCGLHIHLDARDMSVAEIQTVFKRYSNYEEQIDLIMPRSRRGSNRWCGSIAGCSNVKDRNFNSKTSLGNALGRYHKVNLTNIASRGSIEFRQHSGTTNFQKIYNWLNFLQQFVLSSIQLTYATRSQRRTRSKQRLFNELRTHYENVGGSVVWVNATKTWKFALGDREFELNNLQIEDMYETNSRRMNTGLLPVWKTKILLSGGFLPESNDATETEDSFTFGLTQNTIDWLAQRASEVA